MALGPVEYAVIAFPGNRFNGDVVPALIDLVAVSYTHLDVYKRQGEVTATDLEPNMVRFVNERAQREGLQNLRAVLATEGGSGLARDSVDRILMVHAWHHLPDRPALAKDLAAALRPGGRLFVVDFAVDALRGPPASLRVAPEAIIAELAAAGLTAKVSTVAVPDQIVVEGWRWP